MVVIHRMFDNFRFSFIIAHDRQAPLAMPPSPDCGGCRVYTLLLETS